VPEERSLGWSPAEVLVGRELPPVNLERLLTLWRPDTVVLAVGLGALALYFLGVVRLVRRGDRWPVGRSIALVCAVLLGAFVLTGGIATYAPAMFSAHMVQHMTLSMLVPILLALSAPITLALRAIPPAGRSGGRGAREWILLLLHSRVAKILTHPVVALSLYIVTLYGFYFSPLFETAMRSHPAHLLMHLHFLLVGSLFFWPIIAVDPMPRKLPPLGRMLMLFASMPFHAFFGVIVMSSSSLIGGSWYAQLELPWIDRLADQNLGGGIAWATAEIPSLIVFVVVFVQWLRSDERAAARADKHGAADLAAYNERLAAIAENDRRRTANS
jgi:putative copper resistance protein D